MQPSPVAYCGTGHHFDDEHTVCQVAVSLSVANDYASLPIAYQLYLPQDWAADRKRRRAAGVPEDIAFATKPAIALGQIRQALADRVPVGIVLGDAGYGVETDFPGIYREFCVWGGTMLLKEPSHAATQTACHPG